MATSRNNFAWLLLPPLGVALVIGAFGLVATRRKAEERQSAWPARPRVRSSSGMLALVSLWAALTSVQPIVLQRFLLWDRSTASSFLPLLVLSLFLLMLLVRPTDRSRTTLFLLCLALSVVFALIGAVAAYVAIDDVCELDQNFYWRVGCYGAVWGAFVTLVCAGLIVLVYVRYGLGCSGVTCGSTAFVPMHLALLALWRIIRVFILISGVTFILYGTSRVTWTHSTWTHESAIREEQADLRGARREQEGDSLEHFVWRYGDPIHIIIGIFMVSVSALFTPRARLLLQLGRSPLPSLTRWLVRRVRRARIVMTRSVTTCRLHLCRPRRSINHPSAPVTFTTAELEQWSQSGNPSTHSAHLPVATARDDDALDAPTPPAATTTAAATSPSAVDDAADDLSADDFAQLELLKPLGRGTFGRVYSARLPSTGSLYAVKVFERWQSGWVSRRQAGDRTRNPRIVHAPCTCPLYAPCDLPCRTAADG